MSPKQRFEFFIEPGQLAALRLIEGRTAAPVAAQIRRAIQSYLETQAFISKAELRKALRGE